MSALPTGKNSAVGRTEHISLESDVAETRAQPNPDRTLARYDLREHGRGIATCVSILADHYVLVETQRKRSSTRRHTVDLRFLDPRPIGIRKLARPSLYAGLGAAALTALVTTLLFLWPSVAQRIGGVLAPIGLGALAIACFALCYYLTKESLLFVSVHGRARVIAIVGRLGTMRRAHACAADIVAHIKIAQRQFKQSPQVYLRDEMREHWRLREQGALTEQQYDEAKKRILQAHE